MEDCKLFQCPRNGHPASRKNRQMATVLKFKLKMDGKRKNLSNGDVLFKLNCNQTNSSHS